MLLAAACADGGGTGATIGFTDATTAPVETNAAATPTSQEAPEPAVTPGTDPNPTPEITSIKSPEFVACGTVEPMIVLLVDPLLVEGIRGGLDQFETDLCADGYSVMENSEPMTTPEEVRGYLAALYQTTNGNMAGTILIGDQPHAYQWIDRPTLTQEAISFQYYSDLDGTFAKSASYSSPGGFESSYDLHSGDVDWEIWVGVLPYFHDSLSDIKS